MKKAPSGSSTQTLKAETTPAFTGSTPKGNNESNLLSMENEHQGKIEQTLAELGRKMDFLLQQAKHTSGDMQQEVSEKMEELNKSKEKLEQELKDFTQDDEKWKEVQARLQNAVNEIRQAIELSFRKRPKT